MQQAAAAKGQEVEVVYVVPIPEQHALGDAAVRPKQLVRRRAQLLPPAEGQAVEGVGPPLPDHDLPRRLPRVQDGGQAPDRASGVGDHPGPEGEGVAIGQGGVIGHGELQGPRHPLPVQGHPGEGCHGLPPPVLRRVRHGARDGVHPGGHDDMRRSGAPQQQQAQQQGQGVDGPAPPQQKRPQGHGGQTQREQQPPVPAHGQKGPCNGPRDAPEHGPLVEISVLSLPILHMSTVYRRFGFR